jgi:hypothetical protein
MSMPADPGNDALSAWCREHLGAPVAERTFSAGNLSAVYGLRLADSRDIVLKVRPAEPRLDACTWVQRRMWEAGFPCPEPLAGPYPLGPAAATAEAWLPGDEQPPREDRTQAVRRPARSTAGRSPSMTGTA